MKSDHRFQITVIRFAIIIIALSMGLGAIAQEPTLEIDTMVYTVVDEMPRFNCGDSCLVNYIKENVHYPSNISTPGMYEGKVFVNFIVEKDGTLSNITVLKGMGEEFDEEAIRAVKEMPSWKPGVKDGKVVRVNFTLPITFKIKVFQQSVSYLELPAEGMPMFRGGKTELAKYLSANIKYPMDAQRKGIHGRVFVAFVVETDGSISNVKIIQGVCESIDQEALRVVNSMPKWVPGMYRGQPVRVEYVLPLNFSLF